MFNTQKSVKVTFLLPPKVVQDIKDYLKLLNSNKDTKYVSQSEFVREAVQQLLTKESI